MRTGLHVNVCRLGWKVRLEVEFGGDEALCVPVWGFYSSKRRAFNRVVVLS